mmetsp:Transcript_4999/g.11413  ORF Transcript_4999/g.11413 Transcript_4999/m.11413 type:complete len:294 (-) Transcript_4999:3639-4520(-)
MPIATLESAISAMMGIPVQANMASSRCAGRPQRSPLPTLERVKSRGSLAPRGQFNSDLSGCRMISTSSMISTLPRKSLNMSAASTACLREASISDSVSSPEERVRGLPRPSNARTFLMEKMEAAFMVSLASNCRFLWRDRLWQISKNFSMNDLMLEGVDTTTARMMRAVCSLHSSAGVTSLYLSKLKVNTGLRMPAEKRSRRTPAEKSSRAGGTTSITIVVALATSIATNGPTTVVLPAPMIIWWHTERPARMSPISVRTRVTCDSRSSSPWLNSNSRKRGSTSKVPTPSCAE